MHRAKSGRNAARLAAASATAIVLHFGATGSCGGIFLPPTGEQMAPVPLAVTESRADWADWLEFVLMLHRLEMILADPAAEPDGDDDKIQADAVARAKDQTTRLGQSGLRASLSASQIDGGFSAIDELRDTIYDHAQSFTDPFWNNYLQTLNMLEAELDDRAAGAA
ncbi:MAG: hypothetical protein ACF8R9_07265 [Phycisphaerales bacterium JB054]